MRCGREILILLLLLQQLTSEGFAATFWPPVAATVVEYSPVEFTCQSDKKEAIKDCKFTVPGFNSEMKISEGLSTENYKFMGENLSKGECGLRLLSSHRNNTGKVKCKLMLFGDKSEQEAEIELTVLHPIEKLNISSNSNRSHCEFEENDQMEINCTSEGGFPAPSLCLSIGGKVVNFTTEPQVKWSGLAQIGNNHQQVVCRAEQKHSLPWKHTQIESKTLIIYCAPRLEINGSEVVVPVVLGEDANISVTIVANPPPSAYELNKNGELTDSNETKRGVFTEYSWTIGKVTQDDFNSTWYLYAINVYGNTTITIKVIPAQGLGVGAIAAIVLGVLAFPAVVGGGVLHIRKQNFGLVC